MIEPFRIDVPQSKLDRIRAKLELADIGRAPADDRDWRYGTDARYLAEFRDYWLAHYDWREAERELNRWPQFKADVDGVRVHFYHVVGAGAHPFPIILTHGWPGSVVEFLEVIPRLTAQGYTLIIPSLPGYGFSGPPPAPIGPVRVAQLWRTLMVDVLGYSRFGAQGGDWGAMVTLALGRDHPDVVAAIHVNMLVYPMSGDPRPAVSDWQRRVSEIMDREGSYAAIQREKPQTIGLALTDTPIGFAAWVLEKNRRWSGCGGDIERCFTKDQLITNIMTYLVNDAVASSMWMYNGIADEPQSTARVTVPLGFAVFPAEFTPPPPRSAAEEDYNLVRWTEMPAGGHFAAWEQPEMFATDVVQFFDAWR